MKTTDFTMNNVAEVTNNFWSCLSVNLNQAFERQNIKKKKRKHDDETI